MKKALLKDSIKEIKNTHRRFISILLMAFLGVGFFVGIRAASPDMKKTIDEYYDTQNLYDIEIISTLGLTNEDIEAVKGIQGIGNVYGTYSKDVEISFGDTEIVAKVHKLENDVNKVILKEGKLPENIDECVVESDFIAENNLKIGDYIEIKETLLEDEESFFKEKKLKIVGIVQSPLYISSERGSSSLGDGMIDYYIYINGDNIISDVYTEIYANIDNDSFETGSNKYNDYITSITDGLEKIKGEREQARYNSLVDEANAKVSEAEQELNDKKQEAEEEFAKADKEIADAEAEIADAESQISSNEKKANTEFKNAQQKIDQSKQELEKSEQEFLTKKQEVNSQIESTKIQLEEQKNNLSQVNEGINTINTKIEDINTQLENVSNLTEMEIATLKATKEQLNANLTELTNTKNTLSSAISQMESGIEQANNELETAQQQINDGKQKIENAEQELKNKKNSTYNQINNAKKELEEAKNTLNESKAEYEETKQDYENQIKDAEKKIEDAKQEISDIDLAKWYILDRESNRGYSGFIQDTESIENIGRVFPIVFFLIATLISLTSMTRMVEEERVQIGTLKALGYSNFQIASKYVLYASLATLIGGTVGIVVGCYLLPPIIWSMYSTMYNIPNFIVQIDFAFGSLGLILIFLCIVGATTYAICRQLSHMPAILMRPRAPKMGKRVLLERIPFIWKRLNFSRKVTVRNIFRYKKRFLMTIIGIMGCTALILVGFGLRDSISRLMDDQYGEIFKYDMQIVLDDNISDEQYNEVIEFLNNKEEIQEKVPALYASADAINGENLEAVQIIVPNDNSEMDKIINLVDKKTGEKLSLNNNEVIITDKLAELLDIEKGNKIILRDSDGEEKEVIVGSIAENYVYHYIYMSKDLYNTLYDGKYETNVIFTINNDLNEEQESNLSRDMISGTYISSVTPVTSMRTIMDEAMSSLNYVVIVLIISSGVLAFVVLYNLANVNISERIRELATIKVLGFYDKEVYNYVSRETVLLTIIGIALGLVLGYFLNSFILVTCEINILRFKNAIEPLSFIYPILITILFTWIVNIFTYFSLKKINMIESLKSVE